MEGGKGGGREGGSLQLAMFQNCSRVAELLHYTVSLYCVWWSYVPWLALNGSYMFL